MELIYIWIAEYGCIKEQGFNFSPEYECSMEKLSEKKWQFSMSFTGKLNIMRSENNNFLLTVTILAGMNGAGKTTLMKYLNSFHCFYDKEAEGDEYREYVQDENYRQTAVYVFRCQKEIHLFTNLWKENLEIASNGMKTHFYNDNRDRASDDLNKASGIFNITSIYMTNSAYSGYVDHSGAYKGLENLTFKPESLSAVTSGFFSFIFPDGRGIKNDFDRYSHAYYKNKNCQEFQQFCDVFYYNRLINKGIIGKTDGNIAKELIVQADNALFAYQKMIEKNQLIQRPEQMINKKLLGLYSETDAKSSLLYILKLDFVFEFLLVYAKPDWDKNIVRIEQLYKNIIQMYNKVSDCLQLDEYELYFYKAYCEIRELENIFEDGVPVPNLLPIDDGGYKQGLILRRDGMSEKTEDSPFAKYCKFIAEKMQDSIKIRNGSGSFGSFALRYLHVSNLYMSSGERAYQNIMSWLTLVAELENVASSEIMVPKKNILLCIDEIDALCHPQWQRDIIGRLIDDIKEQYQGYSVQLILSTHSPLCLSDAAAENILYMENKNGKIIAKRRQVQTFARNIYDILNDSFYLQGQTMGTYATRYIAELIGVIRNESVENLEYQREILMQKIDIIGDPLIRGKLMQMLTERLTDGKNMRDRKRILEEQKLWIERQLYDLEEEG